MSRNGWRRIAAAAEIAGVPAGFTARTGSTNDDVLARLAAGEEPPFLAVAGEQEQGRGRMGRQWFSPAQSGLYFTLALAAADPGLVPFVSLAAGVACAEAVAGAAAVRVMLKWPNDLFVGGRKLGGILCETPPSVPGRMTAVAVGVGLNLKGCRPPVEIAAKRVALDEVAGRPVETDTLLAAMVGAVTERVDELWRRGRDGIVARWRELDWTRGRRLSWRGVDGRTITGEGAGLDASGRLLVRTASGRVEPVVSGEVEADQ